MPDIVGDWDPGEWGNVVKGHGAQRTGRFRKGQGRNSRQGVQVHDNNRAGHRFYVKTFQGRQFRINIVGFGRWRRHGYLRREDNFAENYGFREVDTRRERRARRKQEYRQHRKNRPTRITP